METEATKLGRTAIVETRKSVNEPDTTGARQDVRLWGFLIILMMIAITSTVGLETRFLIDRGNSGYAIVLVAVFFAVTLGLAIFQTVRALNSGTVVLKGRRGRQPVLEAPEELANAVRDRSAALGLQNVLDIGYLPRTWNLVDAYVAGIGRHQTIVLTGGMMQLFYSSVPERQAQFRFVIDHELGHVAHGDTTVLYLASAAISVFSLALPIKLVLLWWLGLDGMVGLYDSAFPRVFDQSVIFGFLTGPGPNLLMELTAQRPAPAIALSFLLGFFLLMLTVQTCLYVMIVRRREFMADAFAKAVSRDTRNVDRALRDLLSTTGLQQGPRQGFKGGIRWHPKPLERLNAAVDKAQGMLSDWAVALLLVTAIFAFRIAFGASAVDIMRSVSPAIEPVSGVFLLLTGFIVSALLDRRHAPYAVALWLRAFFLSLWSALFAGAIAGLVALGQQPPWFFDFGLNENFANMMRLERLDWTLTILSIPFVILVLALVNVGLQHVMKDRPERFESRLGVSILTTAIALALLAASSQVVAPMLKNHRIAMFEEMSRAADIWIYEARAQGTLNPNLLSYADAFDTPGAPTGNSLFLNEIFGSTAQGGFGEIAGLNGPDQVEEQIRFLNMRMQVFKAAVERHELTPPLGLFLLWQGPFRSSIL